MTIHPVDTTLKPVAASPAVADGGALGPVEVFHPGMPKEIGTWAWPIWPEECGANVSFDVVDEILGTVSWRPTTFK